MALPIIIDLVYHLFFGIAIVLVPGAKTNLAEVEELAAPYGHHWWSHENSGCGLWHTPNMWKCEKMFHLVPPVVGIAGKSFARRFWFRQRSTFLPEIVETVEYVHHPQMDEFFHVLWQTHKAIFTTWWCFMLRFTRELSHITYVLSIIYTVYIYTYIHIYIYINT